MGAELFLTHGQMDMTKLVVVFHSFANVLRSLRSAHRVHVRLCTDPTTNTDYFPIAH